MELRLLWVGVAGEDETVLVTADKDAAIKHALSDAPEGDPIVGLFLCAVSDGRAMVICKADGATVQLGVPTKVKL